MQTQNMHNMRIIFVLWLTQLCWSSTLQAQTPVTGQGTPGRLPLWTAPTVISDSAISQAGDSVGVGIAYPDTRLAADAVGAQRVGVFGRSPSTNGVGVWGESTVQSGSAYGVVGRCSATAGIGVSGYNYSLSGPGFGAYGLSQSASGTGVLGEANSTSGNTAGLWGKAASLNGTAGLFSNTGGGDHIQAGSASPVFRVANNGDVFVRGQPPVMLAPETLQQDSSDRRSINIHKTDTAYLPGGFLEGIGIVIDKYAGSAGHRNALFGRINAHSASSSEFMTGVVGQCVAEQGNCFGMDAYARALDGGTTTTVIGAEIDTDARSAVQSKIGLQIVDIETSSSQGTVYSAGILISGDTSGGLTASGYKHGILLTDAAGGTFPAHDSILTAAGGDTQYGMDFRFTNTHTAAIALNVGTEDSGNGKIQWGGQSYLWSNGISTRLSNGNPGYPRTSINIEGGDVVFRKQTSSSSSQCRVLNFDTGTLDPC